MSSIAERFTAVESRAFFLLCSPFVWVSGGECEKLSHYKIEAFYTAIHFQMSASQRFLLWQHSVN